MWRYVIAALADSGRRGDRSRPARLRRLAAGPARHLGAPGRGGGALPGRARAWSGWRSCVHDWGGLIGLRWACEHPDAVAALVVSNTGFFADGKWHGMARSLRTPGEGEETGPRDDEGGLRADARRRLTRGRRDGRRRVLEDLRDPRTAGRASWTCIARGTSRSWSPTKGSSRALGVPTLILWGENDLFAPVAGAYRFQREIPDAKLVVLEGAGHFVYADEPSRCAREVAGFLDRQRGLTRPVARAVPREGCAYRLGAGGALA